MTDESAYSKIPDWNDTLEECKMHAVKKREAILKAVYQKLRLEIENVDRIKSRISNSMLNDGSSFVYFSNSYYKDAHTVNNLTGNEINITLDEIQDIFATTKYGNKILFDLFAEKFPPPIRIGFSNYTGLIVIGWSVKNPRIVLALLFK